MKKILFLSIALSVISCKKTIQMADGTYISKRQQKRIFKHAWDESFGKMTEEEMQLFDGVKFGLDTITP
jgi:hypothetical protein